MCPCDVETVPHFLAAGHALPGQSFRFLELPPVCRILQVLKAVDDQEQRLLAQAIEQLLLGLTLAAKGKPDGFDYRIVVRRLGYEDVRLAWAMVEREDEW